MRIVCYARVSTDDQAESGAGLAAQLHACRAAAARLGGELAGTFSDEGLSGARSLEDRPALLEAVSGLAAGDVLLVAKRDRLGRDPIIVAMIEAAVARKGARLLSAAGEGTEGDEPSDVLMRRIVDAFAEYGPPGGRVLPRGGGSGAQIKREIKSPRQAQEHGFGPSLASQMESPAPAPRRRRRAVQAAGRLRNRRDARGTGRRRPVPDAIGPPPSGGQGEPIGRGAVPSMTSATSRPKVPTSRRRRTQDIANGPWPGPILFSRPNPHLEIARDSGLAIEDRSLA